MWFKALCYSSNKLRLTQSECIILTTTESLTSVCYSIYFSSHEIFNLCFIVSLSVTLCELNEDLPAFPQVSKH